jgi:hypothetical protein
MSSASIRQKLWLLVPRRRGLLRQLLQDQSILRGSFNHVSTRCGKANCWCATDPKGHAHARLTWSEEGALTTRKVPSDYIKRVIKLTQNYRQFRSRRRKLTTIEARVQDLLDQYEKALIAEARKPLCFLALTPKMSTVQDRRRQTRPTKNSDPMSK